jgi:predicted exporter
VNRRGWLLAAWCVLLAAGVAWVQHRLVVSADLRLFLPSPRTEAQRLLVQNIGESPASRMLLVALRGDDPAYLARISKQMAATLSQRPEFDLVANGDQAPLAIPEKLLAYRYLLTDSFDARPLDAARLGMDLEDRAADMASPAAGFLEQWVPRDPTLELLHLGGRWQPRFEPHRIDDVWFTADGKRALLLAETRAAAFDPDGQTEAIDAIQVELMGALAQNLATDALRLPQDRMQVSQPVKLEISGSGYFSSVIKGRTQREAGTFGAIATAGLILLLWIAYRSWSFTLLAALPLVSGALAGLAAVSALFETVHGITLAFGFTLIGVAQDYPIHLFSHLQRGEPALVTARKVWPPLATGVISTSIAYLAFLVSGVTGLVQLACLTVTGLLVAGLTTRFLLPRIVTAPQRDPAGSALLERLNARIRRLPRALLLVAIIPIAAVAVFLWRPENFWQNDLSKLTPVPPELLRADMQLRREMATPDLRYLLVVSGASEDAVLEGLEGLEPALAGAVQKGSLGNYDHAALYLPSAAHQRARQAALPDAGPLREMLRTALVDSPFEDGLFEPFVDDVTRAKSLPPLNIAGLEGTPLATRLGSLLFERGDHWYGLVSLFDMRDANALAALAQGGNTTFLDLKSASQELVAAQRGHIVLCLGIAALLLVALIWLALRRTSRVLRVLAPMVLTTFVILTVLRACGVSLNLFHLISLVLAAGLGLDYALFFEHAATDPAEQHRTLHALLICSISTLLVFALLAFSTVPILQAIGVTVTLGVVSNFVLALLLTRERA